MRTFVAVALVALATTVLSAGQDGKKVEVKGPHICCNQCINIAKGLLAKVDGVSDVNPDKNRTVTFTAKNDAAAKAGVKALLDGGFFGTATADGKQIKVDVPTPKKGDKADTVSVKDVHVCCGQCVNAVKAIFKDSTVTFDGSGKQKTVIIKGAGLDRAEVLESLHKGGFNGTVEK